MSADPTTVTGSDDLDDVTRQLVRGKARQIVRQAGFSPSDADDLEQDITLHVWKRLAKYDCSKADQAVFVRMLVGHATATVLRDRKRQLKPAPLPLALALREGDAPVEPIDLKTSRRGQTTELALDVDALLATLPPRLRQLAAQLKANKLAVAAQHLGISRATAYSWLAQLREAFHNAG